MKTFWDSVKKVFRSYSRDSIPKLSASLTYYIIFSAAPILLIVIKIAGIVYGPEAVKGEIASGISNYAGPKSASFIETLIKNNNDPRTGIAGIILGGIVLIVAATSAFADMQDSMNRIWNVKKDPDKGISGLIMSRLISFVLIVVCGILMIISFLITSAAPSLFGELSGQISLSPLIMNIIVYLISIGLIFLVLFLLYKFLPDVKLKTSDVIMGTVISTILFIGGQFLISLYLNYTSAGENFGAAGVMIVFLIWVYYSAQVLFLGTEIIRVYTLKYGSGYSPDEYATRIEKRA